MRGDEGFADSAVTVALTLGTLFGTVLLAAFGWFLAKKLVRQLRRKRVAADAATALYQKMELALRRVGLKRSEHQTPMEFAHLSGIPEAVELTERYQSHRFGGRELTKKEALEIESLIQQIRSAIRGR